jgi:hypothetical protein
VAGLVLASRATMRAALPSDKGPWKVRRVMRGGRSSSVTAATLGSLGHPDKFITGQAAELLARYPLYPSVQLG